MSVRGTSKGLRCAALLIVALLAGCRQSADPEILRQAYALAQEDRWAEVRTLARLYALEHPADASAHLLLGQAYLYADPPLHALAVGEFGVALGLEKATGDIGALRVDMDLQAFRLTAYQETAYAHVGWIARAREIGVPVPMVVPRLHEAMAAVTQGLAVDADAEFLLFLKERIQYYLDTYGHLDPRGTEAPPQSTA
jgi:hypothetical protein